MPCERLGYERAELLGRTILDIQPGISTIEEWQTHVNRLRSEGHDLFRGPHVRRDDRDRQNRQTCGPGRAQAGWSPTGAGRARA